MSKLHKAYEREDLKEVKSLLSSENINTQNKDSETPLYIASKYGDLNTVKVLMSREECNFTITDRQDNTPLHIACLHGHHSVIEFLVADQRCWVNAMNGEGKTPLHMASEHGDLNADKNATSTFQMKEAIPHYTQPASMVTTPQFNYLLLIRDVN